MHLPRVLATVSLAMCLVGATPLLSQRAGISVNSKTGFVLDAGTHELRDIITAAAMFLGRNYLFSQEEQTVQPQSSGGRVGAPGSHPIQLQKKLILDAVACEEVVGQLAYSRGFVIVPMDRMRGIYEVLAVRGSRHQEIRSRTEFLSPEEILRRSKAMIPVQTIVAMKNFDTRNNNMSSYLQQFSGSSNSLTVQGLGSRILLRGLSDRVAAAIRLLHKLDVEETPANPLPTNYSGQLAHLQQQLQAQAMKSQQLQARLQHVERLLGKKQLEDGREPGAKKADAKKEASRPQAKRDR